MQTDEFDYRTPRKDGSVETDRLLLLTRITWQLVHFYCAVVAVNGDISYDENGCMMVVAGDTVVTVPEPGRVLVGSPCKLPTNRDQRRKKRKFVPEGNRKGKKGKRGEEADGRWAADRQQSKAQHRAEIAGGRGLMLCAV